MSRRDPLVHVHQMQDYAIEARDLAAGRVRSDLDDDRTFYLAVSKLAELVGETARRVPDDFRARHPHIPWRQVSGFRNILVHQYERVDFDEFWDILQNEIPPLIDALEAILVQEGCRDESARPLGHDHPI